MVIHECSTLAGRCGGWRAAADQCRRARLVTPGEAGVANVWDTRTFAKVQTLPGHELGVLSVAFSPDGKTIASGSRDKTIRIWDVATGRCIRVIDSGEPNPWYIVNLCRFEQSDIEEFLPHLAAAAKT